MSERILLDVPGSAAGVRLDRFVAEALTGRGVSRARVQTLITQGRVAISGVAQKASHKLRGDECISVELPEPEPLQLTPEPMALEVLFEDRDLIAINKPPGLSVHPGAGRTSGTLVNGLLAQVGDLSGIGGVLRPGIVHRLDAGTSGVIIVAKHDRAHEALARQFARREIEKRYLAVVLGTPRPEARTISTMYGRHPTQRRRFSSKVKSGKPALTSFVTLASRGGLSLLDVLLGTGRTHQIRVHLADLGHPVAGDPVYGGKQYGKVEPELRAVCLRLQHQALHARRLVLTHPRTGATLVLEAPPPPEVRELVDYLSA